MSNPFQFVDVPRQDPEKSLSLARIHTWDEIYGHYGTETAQTQAGRCISCGNFARRSTSFSIPPSRIAARVFQRGYMR